MLVRGRGLRDGGIGDLGVVELKWVFVMERGLLVKGRCGFGLDVVGRGRIGVGWMLILVIWGGSI